MKRRVYEVLDYKKDPRSYVRAKVLEGLIEGRLALEMLRKGFLTNSASKAFISVKAIISALVVKNLDRIIKDKPEKERGWYEKVGYSAPTTGLIGISYDLERLGYNVGLIVRIALTLHAFSYNGFDPNLVNYRNEEEVEKDIMSIIQFLTNNVKKYFEDTWNEELEKELKALTTVQQP